ncbi:MAG: hypothetical protein QOC81_4518 [Thermoanaerobaculia bacterium]|jgi:hypothetical protein|nr:hypothetical protein [Thermoanaerobaculia bacterium]
MNETPDLTVAKRIAAELVRLRLLKPDRAKRFAEDLGEGRVKNEDWKLLADPPHDKPNGTDNAK